MLTLSQSRIVGGILRYVAVALLSVTIFYFATLEGCKKKEAVTSVIVLRDSTDQVKIDSLIKANTRLVFNQEELKKGIDLVRSEQKFNKKLLNHKYEDIKKSNTDTLYRDVTGYLRDWKPED